MAVSASDFTSGQKIGPPTETNTALRRMLYWMARAGGSVSIADLTDPTKIGPPAEDNTILRRLLYWDIAISNGGGGGGGASAATQAQVNAGVSTNTYVSPNTMVNFGGTFVNQFGANHIDFTPAVDTSMITMKNAPGQSMPPILLNSNTNVQLFAIDASGDVTSAGGGNFTAGVLAGYYDTNSSNWNVDNTGAMFCYSASQFQADVTFGSGITMNIGDGINMVLGTTTGLKIGTGTNQLIGFYNSTPIVKPTVNGAKAGNAALTSLCTQLANLGLITNSTT